MNASGEPLEETDRRFMAAAIELSRKHLGLTGTNPSVGALVVRFDWGEPVVVGQGVTAKGGRPHAEPQALAQAGELARGATAYVTLEPCAHHGHTPPCTDALIAAGVARVVIAAGDPDPRVSGKGVQLLRAAGVDVTEGVLTDEASDALSGYLMRSRNGRPEVIVKIAVSRDGKIGISGGGQVAITGAAARQRVHQMRSEYDAILVGVGTAIADDPELTCRLPGKEDRSPIRLVLDPLARLPLSSRLATNATLVPTIVVCGPDAPDEAKAALNSLGVETLTVRFSGEGLDLPQLLGELARRGISTLMVEGGAVTVSAFLKAGLVDRIALFSGAGRIGSEGVDAPFTAGHMPAGLRLLREARYGDDLYAEYVRNS